MDNHFGGRLAKKSKARLLLRKNQSHNSLLVYQSCLVPIFARCLTTHDCALPSSGSGWLDAPEEVGLGLGSGFSTPALG
jgi:hypothetical protein